MHGPHGLDAGGIQVDGIRLVQPVARDLLEERLQALVEAGRGNCVMEATQFMGNCTPFGKGQHNMSHEGSFQVILGDPENMQESPRGR
jgi:hypothetical protein